MARMYQIKYPSGKEFKLTGRLKVHYTRESTWLHPIVQSESGKYIVLDQRAVVSDGEKVVYSPRMYADGLSPDMQEWMRKNPEWAK